MNRILQLSPYTLKRYEQKLDRYFFFNVKDKKFWETDYITGSVVAGLDGSSSVKDVLLNLYSSNSEIDSLELEEYFCKVFNFLFEEGYICEKH